jgi:anti-sigma factor RsiW
MSDCDEVRHRLHPYIDNELAPEESLQVEAHLMDCARCRAEYDAIRSVVDVVRGARPLYEMPETSAARAQALIAAHGRRRALARSLAAGSVVLGILALLAVLWWRRNPAGEDRFAPFAAENHVRYARAIMPLDFTSPDPAAVTAWLQKRLPFRFALPDYPAAGGEAKRYTLLGARLLQLGEEDLAYVAYTMRSRPISLLVASSEHIQPSGERAYVSGRLKFYISSVKGLDVIAWTDRGLSYALVSELTSRAAESCAVCHGPEAERHKFERLTPAR